jgi:hypothetical protein
MDKKGGNGEDKGDLKLLYHPELYIEGGLHTLL